MFEVVRAFIFILLFIAFQTLFSQTVKSGKWGLEVNYQLASILKHSPKIIRIPKELSHGIELNLFLKTYGEKNWHKALNFPETGISLNYWRIGEPQTFGQFFSVMGFARFYLYRTKYVNLYARMAGGVGFATRYFNYLTNPENNIIGSMANIAVQFRLGVEWKINPYCQLNTAFTFSHFSNGASQMPNYGMNLPSGTIGIKVFPQPKEFSYNCSKNKVLKRHEINVQYHFGLQEYGGFNGPKFPVHGGSIFYAYYTSFANKIYAGFAMEYYPLLRSAALSQEFVLKEGNTWGAIYPSVILGDEIMLGRASMYYQLGLYTPKRERAPNWLYFRLGGHIYFAQLGKHKQYKIFGGTNVKAHLSVANYWGFNAGASAAF